MNECVDREIREMLPDLLHRTLRSEDRERVELHVATCATCRDDLAVLRTVKEAAVFAPAIDVGQIVSRIPPYTPIIPEIRAPARSRITQWLVAAAAAVLVVAGGSVVLNRNSEPTNPVARGIHADSNAGTGSAQVDAGGISPGSGAPAHTFALAGDVASLSDGDLVQLMSEMDNFDALPAAEPDPVIAVDSLDSL